MASRQMKSSPRGHVLHDLIDVREIVMIKIHQLYSLCDLRWHDTEVEVRTRARFLALHGKRAEFALCCSIASNVGLGFQSVSSMNRQHYHCVDCGTILLHKVRNCILSFEATSMVHWGSAFVVLLASESSYVSKRAS